MAFGSLHSANKIPRSLRSYLFFCRCARRPHKIESRTDESYSAAQLRDIGPTNRHFSMVAQQGLTMPTFLWQKQVLKK